MHNDVVALSNLHRLTRRLALTNSQCCSKVAIRHTSTPHEYSKWQCSKMICRFGSSPQCFSFDFHIFFCFRVLPNCSRAHCKLNAVQAPHRTPHIRRQPPIRTPQHRGVKPPVVRRDPLLPASLSRIQQEHDALRAASRVAMLPPLTAATSFDAAAALPLPRRVSTMCIDDVYIKWRRATPRRRATSRG